MNAHELTQLGMGLLGLLALFLSLHGGESAKWAPIVGLASQPFWFHFAVETRAPGLFVLACAYTGVYVYGAFKVVRRSA